MISGTFMKRNLESVAKVRQSACLLGTFSLGNCAVLLFFGPHEGGERLFVQNPNEEHYFLRRTSLTGDRGGGPKGATFKKALPLGPANCWCGW